MPSPILMTVPTSVTVTPASKFSICRRMISLISFALIGSMIRIRVSEKFKAECSTRLDHLPLYLFQLPAHGAVVERRADARHDAADERVVYFKLKSDAPAR